MDLFSPIAQNRRKIPQVKQTRKGEPGKLWQSSSAWTSWSLAFTFPASGQSVTQLWMSLWLTSGMTGGAGGDWGQRIGSEYLVDAINANTDNIHILLHEMGHGYGLDDFYDWQPPGVCCFLMNAGTATQITDFDKWMLRDFWRHIKSRYGL